MVRVVAEHLGGNNRRFELELDDAARIESVIYRDDSLCISSQVGCAVACPFCASGANGLGRQLTHEELVGQVQIMRELAPGIKRITVSGIGEPLHNANNVASFIQWCNEQETHCSLTTSGGPIRRLREFMHIPHRGLTVSVHAGTESVRKKMVPNGPPLAELFETLCDESQNISRARRKKVALAYLVIKDQNDSSCEIDAFLERAKPLGFKIQLYAYNPVPNSPYDGVDEPRYQEIYHQMVESGLNVRRSSQARIQKNGGCGTLVAVRSLHRSKADSSKPIEPTS